MALWLVSFDIAGKTGDDRDQDFDDRGEMAVRHLPHQCHHLARVHQHNRVAGLHAYAVQGVVAGKSFFQGQNLRQTFLVRHLLLPGFTS